MKKQLIDTIYKNKWQKRWNDLHDARFDNDFKLAELAHEIREEFPKGDAGDMQFCTWTKANLKGARPKSLLSKVAAFAAFDEKQWRRLGGWAGITFLMGLTAPQRYRIIDTLHGDGPFHYTTLRMRGLKLGIVTKRKGRDTRARSEERVTALRMWLLKLYKKHPELPPMPADVKAAITPNILTAAGLGAQGNA